jgi:hypothetical protein
MSLLRLSSALHGTLSSIFYLLGSYLRDAFLEGRADAVACVSVPRASVFYSSFLLFAWWPPLLFLVRKVFVIMPEVNPWVAMPYK